MLGLGRMILLLVASSGSCKQIIDYDTKPNNNSCNGIMCRNALHNAMWTEDRCPIWHMSSDLSSKQVWCFWMSRFGILLTVMLNEQLWVLKLRWSAIRRVTWGTVVVLHVIRQHPVAGKLRRVWTDLWSKCLYAVLFQGGVPTNVPFRWSQLYTRGKGK